jgi:DNA segregation ATPase FtsK/SpoIIIE, S-DNA-T family
MALHESYDTDERAIPESLRLFMRNRAYEACGLLILVGVGFASLSLASWSAADPSFDHATALEPRNWLGYPGAVVSDLLAQYLGLASLAILLIPLAWSYRLLRHSDLNNVLSFLACWLASAVSLAGLLASLPTPSSWPLGVGLGGQLGDSFFGLTAGTLSLGLKSAIAKTIVAASCTVLAIWCAARAIGLSAAQARAGFGYSGRVAGTFATGSTRRAVSVIGAAAAAGTSLNGYIRGQLGARQRSDFSDNDGDILTRLAPARRPGRRTEPLLEEPTSVGTSDNGEEPWDDETAMDAEPPAPSRVRPEASIKAAPRAAPTQKSSKRILGNSFELPDLTLLAEPKKPQKQSEISADVLEHNARMLEGVLDDFGVKGQIIDVKPGPVVTLYELEPAPGIKSSRVISLADDIARSMSAISARVAVVQGRNAIGIELPNAKRETVYLREMFCAPAFSQSTVSLTVALGKNIGGEPIYADLARMPHLLIAGTTGSGKSVGINTLILSLLYRLPPDRCKLIMIDPKMLELSVYEGIPHLLAPVVTDPRKAVVALKWAVKEMEDRYKKMSKVGVRNVDGYNSRVAQLLEKGEKLTRTVQTGFDPTSGEPIFEHEEMDTAPMPFIVVIIDEMADLMMVAGKDIEGAVQRLAQMARAAGIHVVMATQRPSVDVITGTIKANFPTRISFQVTSKIDSRTILGEQGAEQLLGQGDMLYMAGGGRISRLHGPFVSDGEVEAIVKHLKAQGAPDYIEAVTEEADEADMEEGGLPEGGSGDELYDQAVAVVLRDKKVSTSYVQRRLQVGYNKAASLIERMEKEGLISAANATGKREILVPGDSARL